MMASEVGKTEVSSKHKKELSSWLIDELDCVNELLCYRKFDLCLQKCLEATAEANLHQENKCVSSAIEALCIVAVQAYAELNRWQEVLPYITQLYHGIEDSPVRVVQTCLLLYSHVQDYSTCNAIAHIWLRNPKNFELVDYHEIVGCYLVNVMVPQKTWDNVSVFLNQCGGLSQEKRNTYVRHIKQLKDEETQKDMNRITKIDKPKDEKSEAVQAKGITDTVADKLTEIACKLYRWLSRYIPIPTFTFLRNLAVFGAIVFVLITKCNIELLSYQHILQVFGTLKRIWISMFAPYHAVKKS